MKEGLIFANARAKAKERNLISEERLKRMIEVSSLEDAVRILYEINYAGGMIVEAKDFYSILDEEKRITNAFVKEVCPEGIGMECFFLKNDYHNVKVLLKEKYGNVTDISGMLLDDGLFSINKLKEGTVPGDFENNMYILEAYLNIDSAFSKGNGSPRIIDTEMDKAMFKDFHHRLGRTADIHIKRYFTILTDATNILSFMRTVKIGESYPFFVNHYVEGGTLAKEFFQKPGMENDKLSRELSGTEYKALMDKAEAYDLSLYETALDNYLLNIFSSIKADMFSAAPIVGYYLGKMNEIKVIRVILVCLKNNVEKEEMKKRIRALYS